ncbi:MAG: hypothetical protein HY269_02565, partial [Deltaproteobacteria bacterium]|nr:hypothetical protein [Deltaproteobacteria bacterium]
MVADLKNPRGVAAASATIFYITDTDNHVVRRVDTAANSITIVAGKLGQAATDPTAVNGDGGLATNALLKQPYDVAIDVSGDLYISDTGNHKIRKVTFNGALTGNISTIAGNGSVGNVLGTVSDSIFSEPRGMAYSNLNNGTLYVADSGAHRVIAIPSLTGLTSNTQISVIAGNGNPGGDGDEGPPLQAQLNGPRGVALDGSRILIADTNNHKVREVTTVSGSLVIRTFAGTGTPGFNAESGIAATTLLNAPTDVVADAQSNVYITDSGNHRIRKIDTSLTMTTMAGRTGNGFNGDGAPATAFTLNAPSGLIFINNSVVFMDTGNRRLRRVMGDTISSIVSDGSGGFAGDTGLATLAKLSGPSSIAVDSAGNWYIADTNNQVIRKVTASDSKISTIAGLPGMASVNPTDLNGDGGPATQATFKFPTGVAVDASGNIFVADTGNKRIRKIDHTTNVISTVMGLLGTTLNGVQALVEPVGVAVDTLNNLYVTDAGQHLVVVQRGDGATKLFIAGKANTPGFGGDGGTPENARLNRPTGITVAGSIVYFADTNNHRIRKIERINDNFQISSVVPQSVGVVQIIPRPGFEGDGLPVNNATRLNLPTGVAVDSLGNLFIVDRGNNRIRRVAPVTDLNTNITTNVINTVIGTGDIGFSGDGGPATAAALGLPLNITATATSILIADTGNNRIRQTTEPPNVAPVLVSPGDKTVNEGQALNFTVSASDGNAGQTLNYSMTSSPALPTTPAANAATLNPSTGAFSFTPAFDVVPNQANATKEFNVTFTVTDNGSPAKTDSKTIKITVSNVNGPPTISPGTVPATLEATAANGAQLQLS